MELKDYLHLYLGCECKVEEFEEHFKLTGISYDDTVKKMWCYFENTELGYAPIEKVKPVLRQLSSMTEEEFWEAAKIHTDAGGKVVITLEEVRTQGVQPMRPEVFRWALSKSFDLFGLIDSGLSIDSTKPIK